MGISLTLNSRQPVRGRSGIARTSTSRRLGVVVNRARSGCHAIFDAHAGVSVCACSSRSSRIAFSACANERFRLSIPMPEGIAPSAHWSARSGSASHYSDSSASSRYRQVARPAVGCPGYQWSDKPTGDSCASTLRYSFVSIAARSGGSGGE